MGSPQEPVRKNNNLLPVKSGALSADNLPYFVVTEAKPRLTGSSPEGAS